MKSFNKTNRKIHKWGSIIIALPILLVIVSGLLLLVRKEFAYLQPPTQKGVAITPSISFERILEQVKTVEQAQINNWQDIDRLDVRPSKGITKVRSKNQWEVQIDNQTGEVLQVAYRRSDFFESLHDGTFFFDNANLWLMLPSGIVLFVLWLTGMYLFIQPYVKKAKKSRKNS
ncbi:PepSY domain-containing protein [Thalassotalea sp. LPB0316]|uniref:PepSY-associated TM helix domain-containing protein n=1 Tax=Thalassotalea sp. LPB0316 TaxID=2769490 RepID=UPI00186796BC|nr:PepSY-associated TM helix domain-containing protein [Thalassotalea sp. LPB0316]QOL25300.1 PepSY domain-containing protein [Thalassotalea sp. LPB0316]